MQTQPKKVIFYRWQARRIESAPFCKETSLNGAIVHYPCCEKCWQITPFSNRIDVLSDASINGKTMERSIADIPFDSITPYFVQLEQQSVSSGYYSFLAVAESQIFNTGGIFDSPPAQVPSNIYNSKDNTSDVLGFFAAVGSSYFAWNMRRDTLNRPPYKVFLRGYNFLPECRPCIGSPNFIRTAKKPNGWQD
ncbi:MAG: DUF4249 family protein [Saprospiraceae bacterium]|nr:DUF4249 family protein [Saprospiraceae bacterium]